MLGFIIIFASTVAGLANFSALVVPIAALGLASLSAREHRELYGRARDSGASALADETLLRSVLNGLLATTAAYAGGYACHVILFT